MTDVQSGTRNRMTGVHSATRKRMTGVHSATRKHKTDSRGCPSFLRLNLSFYWSSRCLPAAFLRLRRTISTVMTTAAGTAASAARTIQKTCPDALSRVV